MGTQHHHRPTVTFFVKYSQRPHFWITFWRWSRSSEHISQRTFFTGFSVHFGYWYRAITCSLFHFFHTLRSCIVAGESQTCHRFVFAQLGDLPEAKPIGGRIAAINFMIISLRSSDCSFGSSDGNHGTTATTNRKIIKIVQQKIFLSHDWPRLHVRCDRFNVQHSTERCFFSGERGVRKTTNTSEGGKQTWS